MKKPHLKLKTPHGRIHFRPQDLHSHIALGRRLGINTFGGWLPNPDPVLRKTGKQIEVYRELLRDPLVGGQVRRRKAAVARLEWKLDGEASEKVRETVKQWLDGTDTYRLIKDMLNASLYGYQPFEIIWAQESVWLPERIIAKPQEWFGFDADGMLVYQNAEGRTELPPYKFICPTHEASHANPYGSGDLGMVFWPAVFKRAGLKFWNEFTEKYGAPWVIGKEPRSNNQADTEKLLDALEAFIGNTVGTIPNDSSVEIFEAGGKSSSVEAYDKLIRYCRSEINIALLGQDQTTEKDTNHASAAAGLEVTEDIRDADSRIVEHTFNQIIGWIVELNFGANEVCPKFVLFEAEENGSKELAERDKLLFDAGLRFTPQYWQRAYGLTEGDVAQAAAEPKATTPSHLDFAEYRPTDAGLMIDTMLPGADRLKTQGQNLTAALVADLQSGETADNLLDRLTAAYPEMDDKALQNELARLLFLSGLVGRIKAAEEMQ